MIIMADVHFRGESECSGKYKNGNNCKRIAYFVDEDKPTCGLHSKSKLLLSVNPQKKNNDQKKREDRKKEVMSCARINKNSGERGKIIVSKFLMMKPPPYKDGYLAIFPNFKHQDRKDGFGCSSLSPKSLGPIKHPMKNRPIAKNLENFHQFSKIFPEDLEKGKITAMTEKIICDGYINPVPFRHKYPVDPTKKGNKNIALFSLYYDKYGNVGRFSYIECRYFYCHWYEKLATKTANFSKLIQLLKMGINIQIFGYDGFDVQKKLTEYYLDDSRPFGHELVLYSLLTIQEPTKYPWNIYADEHKGLYNDFFE